ncbi:hypothetical protein D3C84_756290 [compost metagenome]
MQHGIERRGVQYASIFWLLLELADACLQPLQGRGYPRFVRHCCRQRVELPQIAPIGLACLRVECCRRVLVIEIDEQVRAQHEAVGADLVQLLCGGRLCSCRDGQ